MLLFRGKLLVFKGVFIKKKKEKKTSPERGWRLQQQEGNLVVYFGLKPALWGKAASSVL